MYGEHTVDCYHGTGITLYSGGWIFLCDDNDCTTEEPLQIALQHPQYQATFKPEITGVFFIFLFANCLIQAHWLLPTTLGHGASL